jgi:hypothetical protein
LIDHDIRSVRQSSSKKILLNYRMIISHLNRRSGFFSMLFFMMNHYIHALKNGEGFKLVTDNWMFKKNLGWTDYFLAIDFDAVSGKEEQTRSIDFTYLFQEYPISEYKKVIPLIYRYNSTLSAKIYQTCEKLNLPVSYDSIFIRRGDKLINESHYTNGAQYLQKLLEKSPTVEVAERTVFIQTDDYNCVQEIKDYISVNNLKIKIITLCPETCRGMIVFDFHKNSLLSGRGMKENMEYLQTCSFDNTKPIEQMSGDEMYEHTMLMLIGIELVIRSKCCITDYESNIGRFISLAKTPDSVFSVLESEKDRPAYDKLICPGYCF